VSLPGAELALTALLGLAALGGLGLSVALERTLRRAR
jgi:hypothetical protein